MMRARWMRVKVQVTKAFAPHERTVFARASGCFAASLFAVVYMLAPVYFVAALTSLFFMPRSLYTALLLAPMVLSLVLPPLPSERVLQGWPFKYMPAYFDFEEVMEMTDEQTRELMRTKRAIFAAQPHGVFTFGGACSGVTWGAGRFYHPKRVPTAVANVVMQTPFIKHIVGIFGICDASAKTLKKTLKRQSVVLYPGGIAELFLCDHEQEKLFVHKRKGFIKVALQSGVDIVPVYFFGNTQILKVAKPAVLRWLARTTGISLTWFWGVGGLPIPFPRKVSVAVGKPLGLPKLEKPSDEDVALWHATYVSEVQRLFDTYKATNPDFIHKQLIFEP